MPQREGSHLTLERSAVAQGPERAVLVKASSQLTAREQRRVNLLPLEEGPFGEGEENNLYEEQGRQRAIPEKELLGRGEKDDLS